MRNIALVLLSLATIGQSFCAAPSKDATLDSVITNSEAAKDSPAAAAARASVGHTPSRQELTELVQKGDASRCAVVTVPPGAEVSVDGNRLGVSPLAFVLLKKGEMSRTVTVKMNGYETVEKKLVPDGNLVGCLGHSVTKGRIRRVASV